MPKRWYQWKEVDKKWVLLLDTIQCNFSFERLYKRRRRRNVEREGEKVLDNLTCLGMWTLFHWTKGKEGKVRDSLTLFPLEFGDSHFERLMNKMVSSQLFISILFQVFWRRRRTIVTNRMKRCWIEESWDRISWMAEKFLQWIVLFSNSSNSLSWTFELLLLTETHIQRKKIDCLFHHESISLLSKCVSCRLLQMETDEKCTAKDGESEEKMKETAKHLENASKKREESVCWKWWRVSEGRKLVICTTTQKVEGEDEERVEKRSRGRQSSTTGSQLPLLYFYPLIYFFLSLPLPDRFSVGLSWDGQRITEIKDRECIESFTAKNTLPAVLFPLLCEEGLRNGGKERRESDDGSDPKANFFLLLILFTLTFCSIIFSSKK